MRVLSINDFGPFGFRWLTLRRITWEDADGRVRFWEAAERTTRVADVDGVAIIAKVVRSGQPPQVVVISQYRPPLDNVCLEFPAGLVDRGETAGQAALRELREETGYVGRVVDVWPMCRSDPGMTGANMQIALLEVDGDAAENQGVVPQLDDGEFISTVLVPLAGLLQYLLETQQQRGWDVDARLMAYATGLHYGREVGAAEAAAAAAAAAGEHAGVAASPELSAFGSLVPDDLELSQAVEAAVAAAAAVAATAGAEPTNGSSGSGGAKAEVVAAREAHGSSIRPAPQLTATQQWWQGITSTVFSPQFLTGAATGLAVAALWRSR